MGFINDSCRGGGLTKKGGKKEAPEEQSVPSGAYAGLLIDGAVERRRLIARG
jgi:hypothetical protein